VPSKPAVLATATVVPATVARTLFIDGAWVDARAGASFEATNPATGGVIGTLAGGGREDATLAVTSAARAARDWGRTSPFERAAALERIAGSIERRRDALARALT